MRRSLAFMLVLATLVSAAACGGKSGTPTAPSTTNPGAPAGPSTPGPSPSGPTATVTGNVQAALTGVTVSVVGTSISAAVDSASRFTLVNVPAGDISLQLTGGGANAIVSLGMVQPSETVDLVVTLAGSSASIDSQVKSGAGQAELEGRVESLPPTMPALTFKAAGRTVRTDSSTKFVDGTRAQSFADLQIGMRVHVKGSLSGETFTATLVDLQNSQVAVPVEVNGTVDSLAGSASAFQFTVSSRVVKGDAATTFFGDGDKPDTFSDLKNGARVEVKGQQRDGFVYATRIHINGPEKPPAPTPAPATEVELEGPVGGMKGTCPSVSFGVKGTSVTTSAATAFDGTLCTALKDGDKVTVKGTRQADGSVAATRVKKT
jgi:hypothetical protein